MVLSGSAPAHFAIYFLAQFLKVAKKTTTKRRLDEKTFKLWAVPLQGPPLCEKIVRFPTHRYLLKQTLCQNISFD